MATALLISGPLPWAWRPEPRRFWGACCARRLARPARWWARGAFRCVAARSLHWAGSADTS